MSLTASVFLLFLAATTFAFPDHHRHGNAAKGPKKLRSELSRVRNRKGALRAQLRATRHQAHAVKLDIQEVDSKLVATKGRLDATRDRLAESKREQVRVGEELKKANKELAATKLQVRLRLRAIYMESPENALSAIAGTRTGGDLASRGFLLAAIEHKDHDLFKRYTALQQGVQKRKRRQDELVVEVAHLAVQEEGQTRDLADVRQEKSDVLQDLRSKQGELEKMIHQFDEDESRIASQIEAYERMMASRPPPKGHTDLTFSGRFSRPCSARITSTFGMRFHPLLHRVRMHTGVDFGAPFGSAIHAAADGEVVSASWMRGYGNVVILDHGGGFSTVYAHTSQVYCSPGQRIRRGQVIAAVGATGLATGPHLHFEVRVNGHPVNPLGRF